MFVFLVKSTYSSPLVGILDSTLVLVHLLVIDAVVVGIWAWPIKYFNYSK